MKRMILLFLLAFSVSILPAKTVDAPRNSAETDKNSNIRQAGERLLIITRHCQQSGKRKGYIRPIPDDAGITELGIKQARMLGKELKKLNFKGRIYTSPYFRTVATGSYAAMECNSKVYPDARVQRRCRRNNGNLKNGGASLARLRELFPNAIADDAQLADDWMLKKFENDEDQIIRTGTAVKELLKESSGDILIVCHGTGVYSYYLNLTGKKPTDTIWNCAIFKFAVDKKGNIRFLGYDHSFMPDEEVTSNLGGSLLKKRAGKMKTSGKVPDSK